ncbi:MAG: MATE family efflux transporter [Victivallaceae bacterium]|nr:MATE family efflux transporter [Victivallaceae bacterium]
MSSFVTLRGRGGVGDVLKVATPLIVANLGHAFMLFIDRMMLSHYSPAAMGAAVSSGMVAFATCCVFLGTVGYASTFVAQHSGANQDDHIGRVMWQAVFMALFGGAAVACCTFASDWVFRICGHSPEMQKLESSYFSILSIGTVTPLMAMALSCFWSGRGKTRTVMVANLISLLGNVLFNYILIFGCPALHIPDMGIRGAGYATALSEFFGSTFYICVVLCDRKLVARYRLLDWRPDFRLIGRMVRFGFPSGLQILLDVTGFTVFTVYLGKIDDAVLISAGLVLSVYSIGFHPMIGLGMTGAIMVGQGVGARDIQFAKRSVRSAMVLALVYAALFLLFCTLCPELVMRIFGVAASSEVARLTRMQLLFVSLYLAADGAGLLFSNAIKGAGDTRFVMWIVIALSVFVLIGPTIMTFHLCKAFWPGVGNDALMMIMWGFVGLYSLIFGLGTFVRYLGGKWQKMSIIG